MSAAPSSLGELFEISSRAFPDHPALFVAGTTYSYQSLLDRALALADLIQRANAGEVPLCAVYARRNLSAYVGILGTLLAGRGYVPLNPAFPVERTRAMLESSRAPVLIADGEEVGSLGATVAEFPRGLTVILPDSPDAPGWGADCPQHRILDARALSQRPGRLAGSQPRSDSIAYLLFTSGTTGKPKGIAIQQRSVLSYIHAIVERCGFEPYDRFSQNFELTFDLSVHDMFVCWSRGACLCVASERSTMAPARFIRDRKLTCWFSTPSTAAIMSRLRMLRPGAFPSLRWSLFCGEPLPLQIAAAWQQAAPHSKVENLYGPTEATIACTAYSYSPGRSEEESVRGLVPIGRPFGGTRVAVVDDAGRRVGEDEVGELLLGGPQLAPGYWLDPARTAQSFVDLPSMEPRGPWYRTGDRASINSRGNLIHHGRIDDQIKIAGHRVELQEVEATAREACGAHSVVALGWPPTSSGADGIILFVMGTDVSDAALLEACRRRLPDYMVPKEIHRPDSIPLNANGKIDRRKLLEMRERLR